jgi:hypothetical protein
VGILEKLKVVFDEAGEYLGRDIKLIYAKPIEVDEQRIVIYCGIE